LANLRGLVPPALIVPLWIIGYIAIQLCINELIEIKDGEKDVIVEHVDWCVRSVLGDVISPPTDKELNIQHRVAPSLVGMHGMHVDGTFS
jgi:hypothetical protein